LSANGGAISLTAQTGTLDISTPLAGTPLNFNAVTMNVNAALTGAVMNLAATTLNLFAPVTSSHSLMMNTTTTNINATVTGKAVTTNATTFNLNAPLNCATLDSDADDTNINDNVNCSGNATLKAKRLNIFAPFKADTVTTNADTFNLNAPLHCGSLNSDADTTNINGSVSCNGARFKAKTLKIKGPINTEFLAVDADEMDVFADIDTTILEVNAKTLNAGDGKISAYIQRITAGQQTGFTLSFRKFKDNPGAGQPFDGTLPEFSGDGTIPIFSGTGDVQVISNPDNPVNNSPLTLTNLPTNLPAGSELILGTVVGNQRSFVGNVAETSFSLLFSPPASAPGSVFDVLYWNPLLRNGLGDWEKISNVNTLPSGAISATVQSPGTYVLAQRMVTANTNGSALAVRVNSGQPVPIGNAPAPLISLNLPQGAQVLVSKNVAEIANVKIENQNTLRLNAPLPGGLRFVSAMTVDATTRGVPVTLIPPTETLQVGFSISQRGNFAVLYFNPLLNRGQGGWVGMPNARITPDGRIVVDASFTGTFVLAVQ